MWPVSCEAGRGVGTPTLGKQREVGHEVLLPGRNLNQYDRYLVFLLLMF